MRSVDLGGGGTAYYQYDAAGQRVRKVIDRTSTLQEERLYVGVNEVYRYRISGVVDTQRETVRVMDDTRAIAELDTLVVDGGDAVSSPVTMYRYALEDLLGSRSVEVDEDAAIVAHEWFHPYGTTAFEARASGIEVPERRYRYTGMERDEETGLQRHGVRYYAPWLGRWASADPAGLADGTNRYQYARSRPTSGHDRSGMYFEGEELTSHPVAVPTGLEIEAGVSDEDLHTRAGPPRGGNGDAPTPRSPHHTSRPRQTHRPQVVTENVFPPILPEPQQYRLRPRTIGDSARQPSTNGFDPSSLLPWDRLELADRVHQLGELQDRQFQFAVHWSWAFGPLQLYVVGSVGVTHLAHSTLAAIAGVDRDGHIMSNSSRIFEIGMTLLTLIPVLGAVSRDAEGFSSAERAVVDYLRRIGRIVTKNPLEGVPGAGRQGDIFLDGIKAEIKSLDPGATANTIKNVVNNSIRRGGQARQIVIDARGSGLSYNDAVHGARRAFDISRGLVDGITIIGDQYFYQGAPGVP